MKIYNTLTILFVFLIIAMAHCTTSGKSWPPQANKLQNILIEHYQQGNIHYIIFEREIGSGISVVNYTEDSTIQSENENYVKYQFNDSAVNSIIPDSVGISEHGELK